MYIYSNIYIYTPTSMHNNNGVLRNIHILLSPASPHLSTGTCVCVDLTTSPDCLAGDMPTHKTSDRQGV